MLLGVEEHLVDAVGTGIPLPITDEQRLRVASPRDVSAGCRYLPFGAAELGHGEYALSVPDEGDAVSVRGPGRAGFRARSLCQLPKRLALDGLHIDVRRTSLGVARPGEGDKVAVRGQRRRPLHTWKRSQRKQLEWRSIRRRAKRHASAAAMTARTAKAPTASLAGATFETRGVSCTSGRPTAGAVSVGEAAFASKTGT